MAANAEARVADPRRWLGLGVVLCGAFLVMVGVSVVNLAIPAIRATLHATFGEIQLVVAGYTMVYAILLIAGGRLGDRHGRRSLLVAGIAVFTAAAAAGG